jgi:hypothetical protein
MADELIILESASGMLEAEILRGLLESRGIQVWLSQEAAGAVFGFGVGPLAKVDLLIQPFNEVEAKQILVDYHSGALSGEE